MRQVQNNTKNPNVTLLDNPIGVERVIQTLQVAFSELAWLENAYGRAFTQMRKNPNRDQYVSNDNVFYPAVYQGVDANNRVRDFEDLLVNDNLDSYCFFVTTGDEEVIEGYSDKMDNRFSRGLSVIFWFDMDRVNKRLDRTNQVPFQEELNQEIIGIIENTVFLPNDSVELVRIIDDPRRIYEGYTIDIVDAQNLVYPSMGFRYDLIARYNQYCA